MIATIYPRLPISLATGVDRYMARKIIGGRDALNTNTISYNVTKATVEGT